MRKIVLDLDALRVESFDTSPDALRGPRGTVQARGVAGIQPYAEFQRYGSYPNCPSPDCIDTPLASCDGSCHETCGGRSCDGGCGSGATCDTCKETCPDTCGECIPPDPKLY